MEIKVKVNGKEHSSEVEPMMSLAAYLREVLLLTGTHIGCDTSSCGACTITVDGKAVKSCTMLAVQPTVAISLLLKAWRRIGRNASVTSIFKENHGLQCGFCTPGMIMTASNLLQENPNPSEEEIRHGLEGNFCRCTGYHNIVKSIQHAAESMK